MDPFQSKKSQFFGSENYLISFGNLDDFKRTHLWHFGYGVKQQLRRRFHPGNYVFTKLSNEESNLSVVIHHENVDPKAILKKLHEKSMEMATKPAEVEESKNDEGEDNSRIDCAHKRCDVCVEAAVSFDHPSAASIVDYYMMHKIYDACIQNGDNPDEAKAKASKHLGLFFVVNSLSWMDETDWKLTPIDDGNAYQVEFQDGEKIGYAFDVEQYFGEENVRGILVQDSNDRSVIAMILESVEANMRRPEVFVHPMSEFFYESEYRRFVENGQKQENPYFGDQDDQSPFSDLPPNLFVKIVSYLSLKERVLVRRVNTHWRKISNDVLAVGTKHINLQRDRMIKDWTSADLNRVVPLMAGGLESMIFPTEATYDPIRLTQRLPIHFDFEFIRSNVVFRSLCEIDIGRFTLNSDLAMVLMEKASGLKKFTGKMQLNVSEEAAGDRRCFKSVEELVLGFYDWDDATNIGDSYLMALIDLFPSIRRLSLYNLHYISASATSTMAERLGPKLEQLEMYFDGFYGVFAPPLGVFDGIRSCVNLKTLALINSHYISTGFTLALADGCPQLETLVLSGSLLPNGSSAPLEKLAALNKLTKLNVSNIAGVSGGLIPVVREGRLQQLLLSESRPSVELIKACVRYCAGLLLLDLYNDQFTREEVIEIITLYGRYSSTRRTVVRTVNPAWRTSQVRKLQLAIRDGDHPHRGLFVIDKRGTTYGFVENAAEEYGERLVLKDHRR